MENDAFAGALAPGLPDYNYTEFDGGCSSINNELENFHLPFDGVIWEDSQDLIKEGVDFILSIKDSKYRLENKELVDPSTVVPFPAVPANLSHLPDTEQDAIRVDTRHWANAADEIIRASEPQLPEMVSWWLSESSGSIAGVYKADKAAIRQAAARAVLMAIHDAREAQQGTPDSRRASTAHSRPSSAASYRNRSPLRETTSRGSRGGRRGGGRSRVSRDRERSTSPPASPVAATPVTPDKHSFPGAAPYRAEAAPLAEQSPVTSEDSDRIPVSRLRAHVMSVAMVNEMRKYYKLKEEYSLTLPYLAARPDCLHGRAPKGCTDTALKFGIPNGISRPTHAQEYKRPGYVSRYVDEIRQWATQEREEQPEPGSGRSALFPTTGADPNNQGVRDNAYKATPLRTGSQNLLKQGFGYILQHRIRSVELTDSIGSVFLEALGLKIDEFTTSPELFRQALKSGAVGAGKLRITAVELEQRESIIAARVAFRDRARHGVPDDVVPQDYQRPSKEYIEGVNFEREKIPQLEDLLYGIWLSPKKKNEDAALEG